MLTNNKQTKKGVELYNTTDHIHGNLNKKQEINKKEWSNNATDCNADMNHKPAYAWVGMRL